MTKQGSAVLTVTVFLALGGVFCGAGSGRTPASKESAVPESQEAAGGRAATPSGRERSGPGGLETASPEPKTEEPTAAPAPSTPQTKAAGQAAPPSSEKNAAEPTPAPEKDATPPTPPGSAPEKKAIPPASGPAPEIQAVATPPGKEAGAGVPATAGAAKPTASGAVAPATSGFAAPLPKPLFKTHFNKGEGKYVFKDRAWDLAQIKKAFNAVIVRYDDSRLINDIREAGLAAFVEFDEKDDPTGRKAQLAVTAVIRQVKLHPGTIAGIRVADELTEDLPPDKAIEYLRITGGVFHKEIPGVPVVVDVNDWELTCGMPGQSSCLTHKFTAYSNCTDAVLLELYKSGYVDGFELAVNLKKDDADVMEKAMTKARKLFPPPFLIYARTATLSFRDETYPGDAATARKQVAAFVEAPLRAGVDGIDLWAWHRPWKTELRTFLDKGGVGNPLWDEMVRAYGKACAPKP